MNTWFERARRFVRTPKGTLLLVFAVLLGVAGTATGWPLVLPHVLAAVAGACLVEVLVRRGWPPPGVAQQRAALGTDRGLRPRARNGALGHTVRCHAGDGVQASAQDVARARVQSRGAGGAAVVAYGPGPPSFGRLFGAA